jgi:hypothetical protein
MMLSANATKNLLILLKSKFSGFSIFFVCILFFMLVHDMITGKSAATVQYCTK